MPKRKVYKPTVLKWKDGGKTSIDKYGVITEEGPAEVKILRRPLSVGDPLKQPTIDQVGTSTKAVEDACLVNQDGFHADFLPEDQNRPTKRQRFHTVNLASQMENWESIRGAMELGMRKSYDLEKGCSLNGCSQTSAYLCTSCPGPFNVFCDEHLEATHSKRFCCKILQMKDGVCLQYERKDWSVFCLDRDCSKHGQHGGVVGSSLQKVLLVNSQGQLCEVLLCYGSVTRVEDKMFNLLSAGFFPGSPCRPEVLFSTSWLDLLYFGVYETSSSIQKLVQQHMYVWDWNPDQYLKVYRSLSSESFYQYKILKSSMSQIFSLDCPACPKDKGTLFLAFDALFACVRLKRGNAEVQPDAVVDRIFEPLQSSIQVAESKKDCRQDKQDCSNFQAADNLRGKKKMRSLDVSGIFGAACRHEFCTRLMDNKSPGEGFGMFVCMMETFIEKMPEMEFKVFYDIGCQVTKHLENRNSSILDRTVISVPTLHSYGHKIECQMKFAARNVPGNGLSDGETMERVWSYLRGLDPSVKRMTVQHRRLVLSHAVVHSRRRALVSLAPTLREREKRALDIQKLTEKDLETLQKDYKVTLDEVRSWQVPERIQPEPVGDHSFCEKTSQYVNQLIFYKTMCSGDVHLGLKDYTTFQKVSATLSNIERQLGINQRWSVNNPLFVKEVSRKRRVLQKTLFDLAVDYRQLLGARNKYESGQSQFKRFNDCIRKTAASTRKVLEEYNALPAVSSMTSSYLRASFEDVTNLNGRFFSAEIPVHGAQRVPHLIKRQAIVLVNLLDRSREEMSYIKEEKQRFAKNIAGILSELAVARDLATGGRKYFILKDMQRFEMVLRLCHGFMDCGPGDSASLEMDDLEFLSCFEDPLLDQDDFDS